VRADNFKNKFSMKNSSTFKTTFTVTVTTSLFLLLTALAFAQEKPEQVSTERE
jgi:hypothetical protein